LESSLRAYAEQAGTPKKRKQSKLKKSELYGVGLPDGPAGLHKKTVQLQETKPKWQMLAFPLDTESGNLFRGELFHESAEESGHESSQESRMCRRG